MITVPGSRARNGTALAIAVIITGIIASVGAVDVSAHRRDEYLQAARLAVEPDRVELELDLTPGIAVADDVIAEIDLDGDHSLSLQEQQAYAAKVLSAIVLDVDGRPLRLQSASSTFPDLDAVRRGEGIIRIRSGASLPSLAGGGHQIFFWNSHRPDVSVYLANAVIPASDRIAVKAQRHNPDQRQLTIDYNVRSDSPVHTPALLLVALALFSTTTSFVIRYRIL